MLTEGVQTILSIALLVIAVIYLGRKFFFKKKKNSCGENNCGCR